MTPGNRERARCGLASAATAAALCGEILRRSQDRSELDEAAQETIGRAHASLRSATLSLEGLVTLPIWKGVRCPRCSWRLELACGEPGAVETLAEDLEAHLIGRHHEPERRADAIASARAREAQAACQSAG
jgi:hypothetical protein